MPNPSTFPIENEAKTNHHHCWRPGPAIVTVTCQKLGVTVEREFKITIQVLNSESAVQVTFHWQFKLAEWWARGPASWNTLRLPPVSVH